MWRHATGHSECTRCRWGYTHCCVADMPLNREGGTAFHWALRKRVLARMVLAVRPYTHLLSLRAISWYHEMADIHKRLYQDLIFARLGVWDVHLLLHVKRVPLLTSMAQSTNYPKLTPIKAMPYWISGKSVERFICCVDLSVYGLMQSILCKILKYKALPKLLSVLTMVYDRIIGFLDFVHLPKF
jgi:hypothetical protein